MWANDTESSIQSLWKVFARSYVKSAKSSCRKILNDHWISTPTWTLTKRNYGSAHSSPLDSQSTTLLQRSDSSTEEETTNEQEIEVEQIQKTISVPHLFQMKEVFKLSAHWSTIAHSDQILSPVLANRFTDIATPSCRTICPHRREKGWHMFTYKEHICSKCKQNWYDSMEWSSPRSYLSSTQFWWDDVEGWECSESPFSQRIWKRSWWTSKLRKLIFPANPLKIPILERISTQNLERPSEL